MKKIALILDGWKRYFTYAWPSGILYRIKETNEDVNLYIFNSSGDWSYDKDYDTGEYNIFQLPDFNDFDGIILDLNNVRYKEVSDSVIQKAKDSGKPVIALANEIEDFYYVGIDNYKAMHELIEHLHTQHSCEQFWFVMASGKNYENQKRVDSVKDYLNEQEIAWDEKDFYFDNFEFDCGYNGFLKLLASHDYVLPDAVMCANDNIAVGVLKAAEELGYHVPQDFCVTGFDDFDKAAYYTPKITTVNHLREEVGYLCMELFLAIWKGEKAPRFHYTSTKSVFRESCGCTSVMKQDMAEYSKNQIIYGIESANFEEQILALEYELTNCSSVGEMVKWIPQCVPAMNCDAIYLVLDDHMNDFRRQKDYYDKHLMEDEEFLVHGYPEKMRIEFSYVDGEVHAEDSGWLEGLFPTFDYHKGGTDFLFMPLHFRERTVGFFVIRNAVYLMEKQYLFKILNVLMTAIENLHKKEKLAYLNQVLSDLYLKDSMTGLYNRLGYKKLAYPLYEKAKQRGGRLVVVFVDMDRLKYVNDTFGHLYGDLAIKIIGRSISMFCPQNGVAVRNGGDEFLIILPWLPQKDLQFVVRMIREEIMRRAIEINFPTDLTISVGYIETEEQSAKSLDDYVNEADESMYQEKTAKKAERI